MHKNNSSITVSGWEILSVHGIGKHNFHSKICSPEAALPKTTALEKGSLRLQSFTIPDFDIKEQLGRKGTRLLDRHTALSILAVKNAIINSKLDIVPFSNQAGMVHCTTTGSIKSITDFTRDTFTQDRPYLVDPGRFPNTVLNCAAGQCAIWHKLRGPNATLSGGHTSFYSALGLVRRWLENDSAKLVLAGTVEEVSEQTVWGLHYLNIHKERKDVPLSETCAMFVLHNERAFDRPKSDIRVLASGVRNYPLQTARTEGLAWLIEHCLEQAGVEAQRIDLIAGHRYDETEMAALKMALGKANPQMLPATEELMGETYTTLGAVQLALLCAHFEAMPESSSYGLATAIGHNGSVACMVAFNGGRS